MRSKFIFSWGRIHEIEFFGTFHEIKIPNNWFDLLIVVFFMRSKFKKSIIMQFWSHDQSVNLLINIIRQIWPHEQIEFQSHDQKFDLMIKNLISWSKIWSHEKVEFWSHEIWPHDHFPIFNLFSVLNKMRWKFLCDVRFHPVPGINY